MRLPSDGKESHGPRKTTCRSSKFPENSLSGVGCLYQLRMVSISNVSVIANTSISAFLWSDRFLYIRDLWSRQGGAGGMSTLSVQRKEYVRCSRQLWSVPNLHWHSNWTTTELPNQAHIGRHHNHFCTSRVLCWRGEPPFPSLHTGNQVTDEGEGDLLTTENSTDHHFFFE